MFADATLIQNVQFIFGMGICFVSFKIKPNNSFIFFVITSLTSLLSNSLSASFSDFQFIIFLKNGVLHLNYYGTIMILECEFSFILPGSCLFIFSFGQSSIILGLCLQQILSLLYIEDSFLLYALKDVTEMFLSSC